MGCFSTPSSYWSRRPITGENAVTQINVMCNLCRNQAFIKGTPRKRSRGEGREQTPERREAEPLTETDTCSGTVK